MIKVGDWVKIRTDAPVWWEKDGGKMEGAPPELLTNVVFVVTYVDTDGVTTIDGKKTIGVDVEPLSLFSSLFTKDAYGEFMFQDHDINDRYFYPEEVYIVSNEEK